MMSKKKWLLSIGFILTASFLWLSTGKQAEPLPKGSASEQMLKHGNLEVASFDIELSDNTRSTDVNGDYEGSPQRILSTTVWHPAKMDSGPYPLIIHSHGFSSMREGGRYIAEHLASLGYIVAAADFPLTHFYAPGGPQAKDVINQPGDVSFIIDSLLNLSGDKKHPLFSTVDPTRIGVMGISLGGMTTTMVTYDPHRRDPRINAAVSIAGPSSMFGKRYFSTTNIPFMMLATEQDALVNYEDNAAPILDKISNATLVTLKAASHTGFADSGRSLRWMDNPDAIGCYVVMKNLDTEEEPWFHLLGTATDGIRDDIKPRICEQDPLPTAMNPLRQHMLTIVSISSFFQSQFADNSKEREKNWHYLQAVMAEELDDIKVSRSANTTLTLNQISKETL